MDQELIERFLDKKNVFAVVGASRDPQKYGHQVYRELKTAGYNVYPVNPKADKILGDRSYSRLEKLPIIPDVVNIVVPPRVTEQIVNACKNLGISNVWMQPGSESQKALEFCDENGIEVVHGVCMIIERRKRS